MPTKPMQPTVRRMMSAIAATAVLLALWSANSRIIERLDSPVAVAGWNASGLLLPHGEVVPLPGLQELPRSSAALSEATRLGIERNADGRVYGLVRVHHWCGHDPIREHLARVDLSQLLLYAGEGRPSPSTAAALPVRRPWQTAARFTGAGWEVSEYRGFELWRRLAAERRQAAGATPPRSTSSPASSFHTPNDVATAQP